MITRSKRKETERESPSWPLLCGCHTKECALLLDLDLLPCCSVDEVSRVRKMIDPECPCVCSTWQLVTLLGWCVVAV